MNFKGEFFEFHDFFDLLITNCWQKTNVNKDELRYEFLGKTHFFRIFHRLPKKSWKLEKSNPGIDLNIEPTFLLSYWRPFLKSQLSLKIVNNIDTKSKPWKSSNRRKEIENVKFKTETLIVTPRELSRTNELSFIIILI